MLVRLLTCEIALEEECNKSQRIILITFQIKDIVNRKQLISDVSKQRSVANVDSGDFFGNLSNLNGSRVDISSKLFYNHNINNKPNKIKYIPTLLDIAGTPENCTSISFSDCGISTEIASIIK